MTDIEQKALAMVDDASPDCFYVLSDFEEERRDVFKALCRAIEQHEAFRQKVHDAVWAYFRPYEVPKVFGPIIIWEPTPEPKPDPLVDIVEWLGGEWTPEEYAEEIRSALDARGFEIREKNDG